MHVSDGGRDRYRAISLATASWLGLPYCCRVVAASCLRPLPALRRGGRADVLIAEVGEPPLALGARLDGLGRCVIALLDGPAGAIALTDAFTAAFGIAAPTT